MAASASEAKGKVDEILEGLKRVVKKVQNKSELLSRARKDAVESH